MRWPILILLPLTAACNAPGQTTRLTMANQASVYCRESGGELVIRQTAAGAKGYCRLRDGRTLDEWEYYRQTHP